MSLVQTLPATTVTPGRRSGEADRPRSTSHRATWTQVGRHCCATKGLKPQHPRGGAPYPRASSANSLRPASISFGADGCNEPVPPVVLLRRDSPERPKVLIGCVRVGLPRCPTSSMGVIHRSADRQRRQKSTHRSSVQSSSANSPRNQTPQDDGGKPGWLFPCRIGRVFQSRSNMPAQRSVLHFCRSLACRITFCPTVERKWREVVGQATVTAIETGRRPRIAGHQ